MEIENNVRFVQIHYLLRVIQVQIDQLDSILIHKNILPIHVVQTLEFSIAKLHEALNIFKRIIPNGDESQNIFF
jgi:hypothetical protein